MIVITPKLVALQSSYLLKLKDEAVVKSPALTGLAGLNSVFAQSLAAEVSGRDSDNVLAVTQTLGGTIETSAKDLQLTLLLVTWAIAVPSLGQVGQIAARKTMAKGSGLNGKATTEPTLKLAEAINNSTKKRKLVTAWLSDSVSLTTLTELTCKLVTVLESARSKFTIRLKLLKLFIQTTRIIDSWMTAFTELLMGTLMKSLTGSGLGKL